MVIPVHYIEKIRAVYPDLPLERLEFNQDGMNNDVVIIDQKRVCRFPKTDWAKADLAKEVRILKVLENYINRILPQFEQLEEEFVSYSFIQGEPLSRNRLLRLNPSAQEQVIAQLGNFLKQLHSIPIEVVEAARIPPSNAVRTREDWLAFYEKVQETLFPHLWKHQRTWIHEHFEPLLTGTLNLEVSPALIHGDLGCYHLLFNPEVQEIGGVIDFGTAGIGNPAIDFASLLDNYGEAIVKRIAHYYPGVEVFVDQARFIAGTLSLQWALFGVQDNDTGLLLAHLGNSALDVQPLGTPFR